MHNERINSKMKHCTISRLQKHLPLVNGWNSTRPQFTRSAIEYDTGGFGK